MYMFQSKQVYASLADHGIDLGLELVDVIVLKVGKSKPVVQK